MTPPQIEHLPTDSLTPYARNARTHSPAQIAQVAASITEFGFTNPVLIDAQGGIIAGHGRVMAAQSLGLVEVPCLRLTHLSDAQKRAYIIADNKLALNAGWDEALLAVELGELAEIGWDWTLTGFYLGEIEFNLGDCDECSTDTDTSKSSTGIQYQEKFAVLVECQSEANQERVYNQLIGLGLTCKVLVN